MRRIGLVGGTGWVSTAVYYRMLNQGVQRRLGGLHGAELVLRSLDLQVLMDRLDTPAMITEWLDDAIGELARGGADVLAYASVTAHRFGSANPAITHIADTAASHLTDLGVARVGVLATAITRSDARLVDRLSGPAEPVFPTGDDQELLDRIIFDRLMMDRTDEAVNAGLTGIFDRLRQRGVDGILLACTELSLAVERFGLAPGCHDLTRWHCDDLLELALENDD